METVADGDRVDSVGKWYMGLSAEGFRMHVWEELYQARVRLTREEKLVKDLMARVKDLERELYSFLAMVRFPGPGSA